MDGRSKPQPLVTTTGHDSLASPSPDGRWIAYSSTVSGKWEVYLRSLRDPTGAPIQISKGGCCPLWPPSGDEIVYRTANGVWSVKFAGGTASPPARLFDRKFAGWTVWNREYALDADGKRFLVAKAVSEPDDYRRINVVLNWSSELERLLPGGR